MFCEITMRTVTKATAALAILAALGACDSNRVVAPKERGICYHAGFPKDQPPKFNVVAENVQSLEYCAAHLDKLRLDFLRMGSARTTLTGAYQGTFLFIDSRGVRAAQTFEGPRFVLLVKAPDGRLVVPGSIVQERPQDAQVIEVPDNLPPQNR